jgi:hypothetical protein
MVVFTLALLAGFGLNKIEKKLKILAPIVLFLLLLDITSPNTEILSTAFTIKPEDITTEMSFKQVTDTGQHPGRWSGMYPQYLTNHGTINCYEALMPKVKAIPADSQYYRGEAFIANYSGSASITYFSPNKVIVKVNATENDKVVINQNYIQGWRASEGTVQEYNGLISTDITPQTQEVVFSYLPTGFLLGVVASAVGLLLCVLFLLCIQRKIKT